MLYIYDSAVLDHPYIFMEATAEESKQDSESVGSGPREKSFLMNLNISTRGHLVHVSYTFLFKFVFEI